MGQFFLITSKLNAKTIKVKDSFGILYSQYYALKRIIKHPFCAHVLTGYQRIVTGIEWNSI